MDVQRRWKGLREAEEEGKKKGRIRRVAEEGSKQPWLPRDDKRRHKDRCKGRRKKRSRRETEEGLKASKQPRDTEDILRQEEDRMQHERREKQKNRKRQRIVLESTQQEEVRKRTKLKKRKRRIFLDEQQQSRSSHACEVQGSITEPPVQQWKESMGHHSSLPLDLILRRLPVRKLCQLRCVCKAWNLMLGGVVTASGKVHGDSHISGEDQEYWFIMVRPRDHLKTWHFMAYSSRGSQSEQTTSYSSSSQQRLFFRFPFPSRRHFKLCSLLGGVGRHRSRLIRTNILPPLALASAGGLMCTFVSAPDAMHLFSLVAFNCLTGSVRVLPPPLDPVRLFSVESLVAWKPSPWCLNMAVDGQDPSRYYIMLTSMPFYTVRPRDLYFEVFDSKSECWKSMSSPVTADCADLKVCDGDFFFMIGPADYYGKTMSLAAYHVARDAWSVVEVPKSIFASADLCCTFLKFEGRLLVGLPSKRSIEDHTYRGFGVWELQSGSWVEIARTPPHLWISLRYKNWHYELQTGGSFFYMVFKEHDVLGACTEACRSKPPLVFDMAQNSWYFLPLERRASKFDLVSLHQPRLSAHV